MLYSDSRALFERGGKDIQSALKKADQGFRESENVDSVWNWKFRALKAEILIWNGRSDESLKLLKVPPPLELATGEFAVRAKAAQGLALASFSLYVEAEKYLKEAESMAHQSAPDTLSEVVLDEGTWAFKQDRFPEAEQNFGQALQLARKYQNHFIEANALGSLGLVYTSTNRFDEASDSYAESLALARSQGLHMTEILSLSNLAWSYLELGDVEKAIATFSEEEKIAGDFGAPQQRETVLRNLGRIYLAQRNYPSAQENFLKAFALANEMERNQASDEKPSMAQDLNAVADFELETGHPEEAAKYNQQALALNPREPQLTLTAARIGIARHELGQSESLVEQIIRSQAKETSLRWQAEADLANIYAAQGRTARAEQQFQKVVATLEIVRSSIHDNENRMAFSFRAARVYDDYIGLLIAEHKTIEALQIAEFTRSRTLTEGLGLGKPGRPSDSRLPKVQNILKQRQQVVLAYRLGPKQSFLWVITPSEIRMFTLPSRDDIGKIIDKYRQVLLGSDDMDDGSELGQDLYRMLIQPAEKLIFKDTRVVLIADGHLTRLNFETLLVPGPSPHYWIDDVEIENAGSLLLFSRMASAKSLNSNKFLLIGDPIEASHEYPVLTHAKDEIKRVMGHVPTAETTVITGKDATPSAYKASHPEQFGFIHIATHGTASETSPLESAIILSPEGERNSFKLYAREILERRLQAELVTISACSGAGRRDYSGEGLVGLAWGFLRAGAHHVIAGLWDVDDAAEPELMDHFYSELGNNKSPAAALRSAKLAMLHSDSVYRNPYYWASLQLYTGS